MSLNQLKKCPCCNSKVTSQDNDNFYYDCPNCGELFRSYAGKVYFTENDGTPMNEEVKPKSFVFR